MKQIVQKQHNNCRFCTVLIYKMTFRMLTFYLPVAVELALLPALRFLQIQLGAFELRR